jgi:hypothetical protein
MAQSLVPALTSIDEEEEILSDLKSITDLDLSEKTKNQQKDGLYECGKEAYEIHCS